jgi:uncharacterized protein
MRHEVDVPTAPDAPGARAEPAGLIRLRRVAGELGSAVLGLSGGVDSTLLAKVCHDELGSRALAVIARSPSIPTREVDAARELAATIGIPCREVDTGEVDDPRYAANRGDRCYFCKHELFTHMARIAAEEGYRTLAYGENADDGGDHRPGRRAAYELAVRAPLAEAGLSKDEVRALARHLDLPVADKPAFACLASRVPVGREVTAGKLAQIEAAESALWDLGFDQRVRVRHHDAIARIEVPRELLDEVVGCADAVVEAVQAAGFDHVTLDLAGYRRGGGVNTSDGRTTLPLASSR